MSNQIPIFEYPGGDQIFPSSIEGDITYKWIDSLGGGKLNGPINWGTV